MTDNKIFIKQLYLTLNNLNLTNTMHLSRTPIKSLVYFSLLFLNINVFAQKTINTDNVAEYYKEIHSAEWFIVHNRLDSASLLYQSAFQFKYPNGNDLYNACLVAYYRRDSILAKHYVDMIAFNGKPINAFPDSLTYPDFYKWLHSDYDSVYNAGKLSNKYKMAVPLRSMLKIDQELASNPDLHYEIQNEFHKTGNATIFKEEVTIDTLKNGLPDPDGIANFRKDSMNLVSLQGYIKKYGFPDFKKVGYWGSLGIGGFTIPGFILWHHRFAPTEIDHLFYKAVIDGEFPPMEWATINMDRPSYDESKKIVTYDPYHMCLWLKNKRLSSADSVMINLLRKGIYLPSLNEYYKIWIIARRLNERMMSDFNPNVYGEGMSVRYQFAFLLGSLLPSDQMIELGVRP